MSSIQQHRLKWNRRWKEDSSPSLAPEPHAMGLQWRGRFIAGAMLDAATGLGRGIATAGVRFDPVYAVDISDEAVRRATKYWGRERGIRWIVADVTAIPWPRDFFALVCAFGFTDLPFFSRLRATIAPGGMLLYEGFSRRQLEVKPTLDPAWTATPRAMRDIFHGWEVLTCEESGSPPFRLRFAAIRPTV